MAKARTPSERKVTMSWEDLAEVLRKSDRILQDEELLNITLVKPKQLLLHSRRGGNGKKGRADVSD